MAEGDDFRFRRLMTARFTGHVPEELVPWLVSLAETAQTAGAPVPERASPAERLADALGDEIDCWIARRGASQRTLAVSRRTLNRALRGDNVTIGSVAEIADALGCDVELRFVDRGVSGTTGAATDPTPSSERTIEAGDFSDADDSQLS